MSLLDWSDAIRPIDPDSALRAVVHNKKGRPHKAVFFVVHKQVFGVALFGPLLLPLLLRWAAGRSCGGRRSFAARPTAPRPRPAGALGRPRVSISRPFRPRFARPQWHDPQVVRTRGQHLEFME